jgi:hypothetical protein
VTRQTYDQAVAEMPGLSRVLHACSGCGIVGSRPGVLDTRPGDYGLRETVRRRFEDLRLDKHGHCEACAAQFGVHTV